jgi:hypothetical protein
MARLLAPLLAICTALTVAACAAPAPLVGLRPLGADVVWISGRASVQKVANGIEVATAFEHHDGDNLAVRVEVRNDSERRLEVGPSLITYMSCSAPERSTCGRPRLVVDPEARLTELARNQSQESARAANDAAFQVPLLLISAAADVTALGTGQGGRTTGLRTAAIAGQMSDDAASHDRALASIAVERATWSDAAFRRNTLFPRTGYGGLVYLPVELDTRFVWLDVRVPGGPVFPFLFEQTVTPVAPAGGDPDLRHGTPDHPPTEGGVGITVIDRLPGD